jgi:hypothetical protein
MRSSHLVRLAGQDELSRDGPSGYDGDVDGAQAVGDRHITADFS